MIPPRVALLLAVALASLGSRAEAACVSGTTCLCVSGVAGAYTVYEASVTAIAAGTTTLRVEATHGTAPAGGAPATVELPAIAGEQVGDRYLVFSEVQRRTAIDAAGRVTCSNLTLPLAEALEIALDDDCYDRLIAEGFMEPFCDDSGCAVGADGASPAVAVTAAALLLALRRRRGRPRATR